MNMKKTLSLLLAAAMTLSLLAGCGNKTNGSASQSAAGSGSASASQSQQGVEKTGVNFMALSGPTGVGAAYLMKYYSAETSPADCPVALNSTVAADNKEVTDALVNGTADIAAVATNVAANLAAKTDGGIQVLAVNTLGVLYILEKGDSVQSMADLAGKTVYATGQGANPEYVLNYLLTQNGVDPSQVDIQWMTAQEVTAQMASGDSAICMLPVPAATALMMKDQGVRQALSLCASITQETDRFEAAFFESVRVLVQRLRSAGAGKKISLKEMNDRINALLKQSIRSEGVINLFSDVSREFSLFDPTFLEEIARMKEKNLALELLKKLILEQVSIYKRTNIVKSEKFSEKMQRLINSYINGLITNEEVIAEMLKLAKQMAEARKEGRNHGLSPEEEAFYDALNRPQAVKDFYKNDELIAMSRELTEALRRNSTIDWQKRTQARAKMRTMIKRLLKKYKYPPDDVPEALQTVMSQCELWADNIMDVRKKSYLNDSSGDEGALRAAEYPEQYGVSS